ncbi:MAG: NADH-ubiquinone/plastoquinone oxidoreductase chain 6 [Thermoleophilia bacterium]|nr:NADH-ubiquinone/plastoquinone oxidoreductase chain 6 [Thermoleophilia bacterium]
MTALLAAANFHVPGSLFEVLLFGLFALLSVIGALCVVSAGDPFGSALSLLLVFVSLGVLYLMLDQPFVALAQILVYAGAVVVLFLFVIAYLGDRRELFSDARRARYVWPFAILTVLGIGGLLVGIVIGSNFPHTVATLAETAAGHHAFGTPSAIGESFLTDYLLEFEVTSLVLLVAAIGGIVLGLTGRARHDRMRKLMHTRSADQQKVVHATAEAKLRRARTLGGASAPAATRPRDADSSADALPPTDTEVSS